MATRGMEAGFSGSAPVRADPKFGKVQPNGDPLSACGRGGRELCAGTESMWLIGKLGA